MPLRGDAMACAALASAVRRAAWAVALAGQQRQAWVASAESCTGGRVSAALTRLPGSSAWTHGGVVSYSNHAKTQLLGVAPDLIAAHGAVSEAVARAMAEGLRQRLDVQHGCCVAITGIAGPDGGSAAKPVGTVWFALASARAGHAAGLSTQAVRYCYAGGREQIQLQATHTALSLLHAGLIRLGHGSQPSGRWGGAPESADSP